MTKNDLIILNIYCFITPTKYCSFEYRLIFFSLPLIVEVGKLDVEEVEVEEVVVVEEVEEGKTVVEVKKSAVVQSMISRKSLPHLL